MVIATWSDRQFTVSRQRVDGLTKLTFGTDINTETKTHSKQEYITRKTNKPRTISIDATYLRALGCDVEREIYEWQRRAIKGTSAYIFLGGRALQPGKFMLTSVKVNDTKIGTDTRFKSAELTLNFQLSSKDDVKVMRIGRTEGVTIAGPAIVAVNMAAKAASIDARSI